MSAPLDHPPPGARQVRQPTGYSFWLVGDKRAILRDAYHTFLRLRWSAAIALIAIGLLLANFAFAAVFYVVGGVAGSDGSFFDMLSFSVQTMATIGYGVMSPKSGPAETVMIFEALFGIIIVALATGLVFTKFARATARVRFSKHFLITTHDGQRMMMFRCGNMRSNVIVQAHLYVSAAMVIKTVEGRTFYKLKDVTLVRDRMSGLRRGWSVMHVIDESSPFFGLDAKGLEEGDLEMEISLTGLDDTTMATVYSSHLYTFADVRFDCQFADTLTPLKNGDLALDLTKFDVIEPDPRASVAA